MSIDRPALRRHVTVVGPRSAVDVWDRYRDPHRWTEWSPQIRAVDYRHATLVAGGTGVVHGPAGLRARFRIESVDAAGWVWSVSAAGVRLRLGHTVEPVPGGTRAGVTVRGFAPAVLLYLPAMRWALRRLVS